MCGGACLCLCACPRSMSVTDLKLCTHIHFCEPTYIHTYSHYPATIHSMHCYALTPSIPPLDIDLRSDSVSTTGETTLEPTTPSSGRISSASGSSQDNFAPTPPAQGKHLLVYLYLYALYLHPIFDDHYQLTICILQG